MYREYRIFDELRPYVTLVWSMETEQPASLAPIRILPDNCVEFVIHFESPYRTTFQNGHTFVQPTSLIVGLMKQSFVMGPAGKVGFVAARFSAWGAYHFFSFPLKEVSNSFVNLQDLWKPRAKEIEARICAEKNTFKRVDRLQEILLNQLWRNSHRDRTLDYSLSLIHQTKGLMSVRDLAMSVGCTERQLRRKFDSRVGLSPKEFSRIVRVRQALQSLRLGPDKLLTDISHECGYFDQSHFIRDFEEFTGLTPSEYLDNAGTVSY